MKKLSVKFFPLIAGAVLLSACGDDITEVNMAGQAGIGQVASFGGLPKCTAGNAGEMLYATDSAKVYYCADSVWVTLNGKDGRDGSDGAKGSGCTADSTAKGIVVVCGGNTVGTINGFEKVPEGNFSCSEYDCVTTAYLNPAFKYGELLDKRDGKVYRTIEIGSQIWMAQNLDFYDSSDISLEGQTACYYDSLVFCETYGRLYSWSAAMKFLSDYNNQQTEAKMVRTPHQGVCPDGWHLPSDAEWDTLSAYVDAHNGAEGVGSSLKARYLWTGPANSYDTAYETDLFGWASGG